MIKMFKLYDMDIRTLIDKSPNELDILHTISEELQHLIPYKQRINLMVISYENDMPVQVFINSFEDFLQYVDDYKKRHPEFINEKKRVLKNENNVTLL